MEPTKKSKPLNELFQVSEMEQIEWCEYSGMPSPMYYENEKQTIVENNAEEMRCSENNFE